MTRKAFKYRLYPTQPQHKDLERTLALCRQLYNAALQERREAYQKAGKTVGFYEQKRWLPEIRTELPEYKGVHSQVLQNVIERVDKAFQGLLSPGQGGTESGLPPLQGTGALRLLHLPPGGPNRGQTPGGWQTGTHLRHRLGQGQTAPPPGRQTQGGHSEAGRGARVPRLYL
ncbi:transposase IS605 OrfB family [Meiothermus ruber H328]|nr:transposase IS605 OrfB family [Meiothermus ruber H328]